MKQNYFKSLLVTMLALFLCAGAYAEEKTSTLTFTAACGGTGTADDGAVWTVTSDGSESVYYETSGIHYGTSSAAVSYLQLATSGIEGTISKIVVNASGASGTTAILNVTVGGKSFGSEKSLTKTTTAYTFEGAASGQIIVRLSQTSAKRALYVKSIAVTYSTETPTGTKNPNNSFGDVTEDDATIGVDYIMPTFSTSSDGTKSYTSSDTDVAAINSNGEITLKKAGRTTITVTTAQTATYASGFASYTLIVAKGNPVLNFAQETVTAYLGTDQTGPELTNLSDGSVTYEISDPDIATIQSNGYIQPKAEGTATVTATSAETDAWNSATASYILKVEEAFSVDAVGTYEWVKDASTLAAGEELVIVYQVNDNFAYVMGNQQSNNFKYVDVRYSTDVTDRSIIDISTDKSTYVAPIMLEGSERAWYFHTNNGYLYAAGSNSNNYLKTTQTINDNAKATISITANGNAAVVFQGTYTNRYLKYNSQSSLFSCYSSSNSQTPVQLYRKIDSQTLPKVPISFDESLVEITYGDNYDKQKATADGYSGDLVYTSSDESIVKFHGNNVIDVLGPGTVTITATAPTTETTSESSATYTLKIYEPTDHEINLTFSSAGYLTWVATADIDFSQTEGVTAYQITEATPNKITMVEVDKVPTGAAVMLKGSGTVTLTRTTGVEAFTDNVMKACSDASVTGNGVNGVTNTDVYVLGNGKSGLGFYMLKGTLQAGKGYLKVSEEGNAKDFIGFEITTGVKTIEIKDDDDAAIYNLQGIRVAHPQKGIYVKKGKKYVIK